MGIRVEFGGMDAGGLEIWRYELRAGGPLNRRSGRRRVEGFLLREGGGHACVQPWPEFGHAPVADQLAALAEGRTTPLLDAARRCAAIDGAARAAGRSLFGGLAVPPSHATVTDPPRQAAEAWAAGFRVFKLKCEATGRQGRELAELVDEFPGLELRLDFNEAPDFECFEAWWLGLGEGLRAQVDFLEDPFPFDAGRWRGFARRHGVRLAVDRRQREAPGGAAAVRVMKPAWGEDAVSSPGKDAGGDGARVVFTSAMDHPLGQVWAAWAAARAAEQFPERLGICGLQTHHLFEADAFTERLGPWKPQFRAPGGSGLGFDDLLAELPWERI